MYRYWYDYVKPKYGTKAKPCCMDIDSFIVHVTLEDLCADLPEVVQKKIDTSNYKVKTPLPIEKNKKDHADKKRIKKKSNERICSPGT